MAGFRQWILGLAIILIINMVLSSLVSIFTHSDTNELGCFVDISPGVFQRIHQNFSFKMGDGIFKVKGKGFGFNASLKGGRKMIAVDGAFITEDDRALNTVFKLSYISGPVVFKKVIAFNT
mgnify:CR=1 FL=1